MSEMITLKLVEYGEREVPVDRAEYEAAKAADELGDFIDVYASSIDSTTTIVEPDGTKILPWG